MPRTQEPVIKLHTYNPPSLTAEEYEQLLHEVNVLSIANPKSLIPIILYGQLRDNHNKYIECKKKTQEKS